MRANGLRDLMPGGASRCLALERPRDPLELGVELNWVRVTIQPRPSEWRPAIGRVGPTQYTRRQDEPRAQTMTISEFVWTEERIAHIGRHGVETEEFEDVCFGDALVLRTKAEGENPVYHVLGETEAGRHLFCVVIAFADDKGYPVTARDMTERERRRYARWKRP